jgi:hypothetical protein
MLPAQPSGHLSFSAPARRASELALGHLQAEVRVPATVYRSDVFAFIKALRFTPS